MSSAEAFFDTSVLIYLLSGDATKADRVEALLAERGVISVQVLNEFAAVATRKQYLSLREIRGLLGTVRQVCRTESVTPQDHDMALDIAERYRFSLFDSLIVASAIRAGCNTLYTEDLQHGQLIGRLLTVVNPFSPGAAA